MASVEVRRYLLPIVGFVFCPFPPAFILTLSGNTDFLSSQFFSLLMIMAISTYFVAVVLGLPVAITCYLLRRTDWLATAVAGIAIGLVVYFLIIGTHNLYALVLYPGLSLMACCLFKLFWNARLR